VEAWKRDADERPGQSRFVFAYTNNDADTLNAELRQGRDQRVQREAKEAERQRARAEERERRGLPPEPEPDRERQRQERGRGLGR
jgi:septal ring factor EnvC (AmiA/AmiB activator)